MLVPQNPAKAGSSLSFLMRYLFLFSFQERYFFDILSRDHGERTPDCKDVALNRSAMSFGKNKTGRVKCSAKYAGIYRSEKDQTSRQTMIRKDTTKHTPQNPCDQHTRHQRHDPSKSDRCSQPVCLIKIIQCHRDKVFNHIGWHH